MRSNQRRKEKRHPGIKLAPPEKKRKEKRKAGSTRKAPSTSTKGTLETDHEPAKHAPIQRNEPTEREREVTENRTENWKKQGTKHNVPGNRELSRQANLDQRKEEHKTHATTG